MIDVLILMDSVHVIMDFGTIRVISDIGNVRLVLLIWYSIE